MAIKFKIMQQNVLLEKLICKKSPFLPVMRVPCIQFIPKKSVPREGIKWERGLQVAGTIPHTPKDSGCPICCWQQIYTHLPQCLVYRNVTSVMYYVSTSTSTCPASSYDDICIAEWLESIEWSKWKGTSWCSEDTIGGWSKYQSSW